MNKLLIAGIDPGTYTAYALLDLSGNLVDIGSFKNASMNDVVRAMQYNGKIIIVASDVRPMPHALKKVSRQLQAKTIEPDHDLQFMEKIRIVDTYLKSQKEFIIIQNQHEKDALAAALYGLKRMRPLIKKIQDHLVQHDKMHLFSAIKQKVIVERIPISKAVKLLI